MKGIQQTKRRTRDFIYVIYENIVFYCQIERVFLRISERLPNIQFPGGTVQGILMIVHEILIGHFCKCSYTHYPLQNHV